MNEIGLNTKQEDKTVVVVLTLDLDSSSNKSERLRRERKKKDGEDEVDGEERKLFADGTGMRFNKVKEGWVVALLSRFGRAKLSGD
jgi:hypothetical protein